MNIAPPFILREDYNEEIVKLLKSVTLGSNGAMYQHQRIDDRIERLYKPIFLNLEHGGKVLGNITFCRRPQNWYVRYFAFDGGVQAGKNKPKSKANKDSGLKKRIESFFQQAFELEGDAPETFYAYIDPHNERSLWMSQNFDFKTIAKIATQTFSRVRLKKPTDVYATEVNDEIKHKIFEIYGNHPFFFPLHTFNETPFYTLVKDHQVVAFAKTHQEEWKIARLPGKYGKLLKNILPFIPALNRIIRPNAHVFTVVDSIWSKDFSPAYLEELFEGILYYEKTNTLFWWVDKNEPIYQHVQDKIKWGLLHTINGVSDVDLVVRTKSSVYLEKIQGPTYVSGFDFI
ncbi:MAG: hypothetical protein H3C31_08680 [Brumimicrobium sp.]|nr:hypothetical protein [Brumimicrobium sp.]